MEKDKNVFDAAFALSAGAAALGLRALGALRCATLGPLHLRRKPSENRIALPKRLFNFEFNKYCLNKIFF